MDYSLAFNTIVPATLVAKLQTLGLNRSLCSWILDFLTGRSQVVRMGNNTSSPLILNTDAPQGCVLSPLLYTLYTHDCTATHSSKVIVKFANGGGSACHEQECALPTVLHPVSLPAIGGSADIALASSQAVYVFSNQYIATGVRDNQRNGCFSDTQCPELAEQALVPGPDRAAGGAALPIPIRKDLLSKVSGLVAVCCSDEEKVMGSMLVQSFGSYKLVQGGLGDLCKKPRTCCRYILRISTCRCSSCGLKSFSAKNIHNYTEYNQQ